MAGRRKIGIDDPTAWVFNRMADVYPARPAYPGELIDRLEALAGRDGPVLDLGAGIGHLALPLAERGCQVHALEPAEAMLGQLGQRAAARGLSTAVRCVHAAAEKVPLAAASVDLVLIADAMHFLDAELTGQEVRRVLRPHGALAILTCELGDTPFMREVVRNMEEAAPRRPRATANTIPQLAAVAGVTLEDPIRLHDHTPVDHAQLEQILRSISFIGPAMNTERFSGFWQRIRALSAAPVWSRTFTLRSGRRSPATSS